MQAYYDDNNVGNPGFNDYALISDFDVDEDFIQLNGSRQDYRLDEQASGLPDGTALYRTVGDHDELVGVIEGTSSLSLEDNSFQFV